MKKTVLRYGGLATAVMMVISFGSYFIGRGQNDFSTSETVGYLSMVLSMAFVFFGIKHYRDKENGGYITYGKAFKLGLLIVLIPAIAFGFFNLLYVEVLDPEFMDKYYNAMVVKMKASMPPAEFETKLKQMESEKAMFANPFLQFLVMGATVFIIGVAATAISALVLKRKPAMA